MLETANQVSAASVLSPCKRIAQTSSWIETQIGNLHGIFAIISNLQRWERRTSSGATSDRLSKHTTGTESLRPRLKSRISACNGRANEVGLPGIAGSQQGKGAPGVSVVSPTRMQDLRGTSGKASNGKYRGLITNCPQFAIVLICKRQDN
jgi:hypothetical protein